MNEVVITPEMMFSRRRRPFCSFFVVCGNKDVTIKELRPKRFFCCDHCIRNGKLLKKFRSKKTGLLQFVLRNYEKDYYFPLFD